MSDVFISYSRRDSEFTKRLHMQLVGKSKDIWIDFEDIPKGIDFLQEIYEGIEKADSFCFVVSRHSLTSEICNLELEHAIQLSKRILPIIREKIEGDTLFWVKGKWSDAGWRARAERNWTEIGHLNWLMFDDDTSFDSEFAALIKAAEQNITYVKQHTRLLVRATEWQRSAENSDKRDESLLLFTDEIIRAEKWLAEWDAQPTDKRPQPSPDELHRSYVQASRLAEATRQSYLLNLQTQADNAKQAAQAAEAQMGVAIRNTEAARTQAMEANRTADTAKQAAQAADMQMGVAIRNTEAARTQAFEATRTAKAETLRAEAQRRRARTASIIAGVLIVIAAGVGLFATQQTNSFDEARATATRALGDAYRAQTQVAAQLVELEAIQPGATQGAFWTKHLSDDEQYQIALSVGVTANIDWAPLERSFDGIPYLLVPRGCFQMGGESEAGDAQPVHEQCFDQPFWIGAALVKQADFVRLSGKKAPNIRTSDESNPVHSITWFEAHDFCTAIGGRLPTEAEWEYVVRGPSSFAYVMGNEFNINASRKSWVGWGMSGNLEWTSSIYDQARFPYPYVATDGREDDEDVVSQRVLRGWQWLDDPRVTAARRVSRSLSVRDEFIGFRCVRDNS